MNIHYGTILHMKNDGYYYKSDFQLSGTINRCSCKALKCRVQMDLELIHRMGYSWIWRQSPSYSFIRYVVERITICL